FRVPFDLGRSSFVCFDQDPAGISAKREGRCVVERLSRNHFFRLANIRNDFLGRLPRATGGAGECDGSAHEGEEFSTAQVVRPAGSVEWELGARREVTRERYVHSRVVTSHLSLLTLRFIERIS